MTFEIMRVGHDQGVWQRPKQRQLVADSFAVLAIGPVAALPNQEHVVFSGERAHIGGELLWVNLAPLGECIIANLVINPVDPLRHEVGRRIGDLFKIIVEKTVDGNGQLVGAIHDDVARLSGSRNAIGGYPSLGALKSHISGSAQR